MCIFLVMHEEILQQLIIWLLAGDRDNGADDNRGRNRTFLIRNKTK